MNTLKLALTQPDSDSVQTSLAVMFRIAFIISQLWPGVTRLLHSVDSLSIHSDIFSSLLPFLQVLPTPSLDRTTGISAAIVYTFLYKIYFNRIRYSTLVGLFMPLLTFRASGQSCRVCHGPGIRLNNCD
jgi:hypothetical protein